VIKVYVHAYVVDWLLFSMEFKGSAVMYLIPLNHLMPRPLLTPLRTIKES